MIPLKSRQICKFTEDEEASGTSISLSHPSAEISLNDRRIVLINRTPQEQKYTGNSISTAKYR